MSNLTVVPHPAEHDAIIQAASNYDVAPVADANHSAPHANIEQTSLPPLYYPDAERTPRPYPDPGSFDNPLGRIAVALAPTTEADPIAVMASLIAATATALGPDTRVSIQDFDHPLLVWFILCGPTSVARKGTAEATARRVLSLAMPEFMRDNVTSGLSSGEGLIQAVADPAPDDDGRPSGTDDKRLLVLEDEYATVLNRARRETNTIAPVMRQAWDGRDLSTLTRTNALRATRPHIGVVGHITPGEFKARLSSADLAGGSYNRFLPLFVRRTRPLPTGRGADPDLVLDLAADLEARLRVAQGIALVEGVNEVDSWMAIYQELYEIEEDPALAKWVSRATPYVMRLTALYAALDGSATARDHHLRAAAHLVRYSHESIRFIFGKSDADESYDLVANYVRAAGSAGLGRAVLTKKVSNRGLKAADLDVIVAALVDSGEFTVERVTDTRGRPGDVLRHKAA